ncbi:hypothetical protein A6A40_25240 (plasmid) [Azospirillum humicireducens]|uniref:DUF2946 domain-containing protein n=1 Tax=Azospirillum humicireducens TaxID=1226968 RepID=A0A2R4VV90_9PROT|nr:DUF2946 family protein [Azospirillum humicireducens]AWB08344.1 hypothetical protein A6A40_25240 [Azospirillum humicireducens]
MGMLLFHDDRIDFGRPSDVKPENVKPDMATPHDRLRRFARHGLLAAAVALIVQLIAWAWMPAWSASGDGISTQFAAICTPDGVKLVALDDDGLVAELQPSSLPAEKSPASKAEGQCPLCPLIGGLGLAPVQVLVMASDVERHGPTLLPGNQIATGWFLATLQARAPPSLG